jgi:5-methyltetrahydrofolate--homocysteine methyltransferase
MTDYAELKQAVLEGEAETAIQRAREALDAGAEPLQLINLAISPAMQKAGELFEEGEYFVPELLMAARATKGIFEILRPLLAKQGVAPLGKVVLGTVQGDLHDIGKNLVGAMLEGGGFEVIDLGVAVTPEQFITAIQTREANLVGLSALLTTTMPAMKETLEAFAASGVRDRIKVMIGGAPVTQGFANSIGADGFAENASMAVSVAKMLISQPSR